MTDVWEFSATSLQKAIESGEKSARGAVDASFDRMRDVGAGRDGLNILLYQDRHDALTRAVKCDADVPAIRARPLNGVPVVVKDNALAGTSAWANTFLGRDHLARQEHAEVAGT